MSRRKNSGIRLDTDALSDQSSGAEMPRPNPLDAAARILLERAVDGMPNLAETVTCDVTMVVIDVSTAEWIAPVAAAWKALVSGWCALYGKPDDRAGRWLEHRSDGRDRNGWWSERVSLPVALSAGYSAVGISQAPERHLHKDFLSGADWRVSIPPLDATALTQAVTRAFAVPPKASLDDGLCRLLTPSDLLLSQRQGQDADAYLARLRTLARAKAPKGATVRPRRRPSTLSSACARPSSSGCPRCWRTPTRRAWPCSGSTAPPSRRSSRCWSTAKPCPAPRSRRWSTTASPRRRPHEGDPAMAMNFIPGYVLLTDVDGLRHVVRVSSIQMMSDSDPCQDTTVAVVAGRALSLPMPLEEFLGRIADSDGNRRPRW